MREIKEEISHYIGCEKKEHFFPWKFVRWWTTFPLDNNRHKPEAEKKSYICKLRCKNELEEWRIKAGYL